MGDHFSGRRHWSGWMLTIVAATAAAPVFSADEWRARLGVYGSEIYSSNISLANNNSVGQESFVTLLMPNLSVQKNKGPWRLNFNYSLQNLFYAGDYSATRTSNFLQLSSQGRVSSSLFVNAFATVGQYNSGLGVGRTQLDNISRASNVGEYKTVRLNPYWTPHFHRD